MNAYTYPTMEIELDGTTVLVSYRENTSSVQVMDIKPVGNVQKEDMDWVTSHIDIIERMVAKELRPPVQDFDDIGDWEQPLGESQGVFCFSIKLWGYRLTGLV